ncbi:hypothetical protein C922_05766 [Plasmodium inui San Antonio 1]|uniref:Uncharacterized protein n=1 Tax=Plasmodium inui San Antonio 1 TaxID=1237626 RepID=W7A439_9APIC|nr:hypothetical protein C922_05766 [Plasmodium inui San Antonio 1]EUD63854.1 hypothetical protein C922_05766 [Plasmodium inui San Antonio 1]
MKILHFQHIDFLKGGSIILRPRRNDGLIADGRIVFSSLRDNETYVMCYVLIPVCNSVNHCSDI